MQEGNTNSSVELSVRHGLNQWSLQAVEKSAEEIQTNPENEDRAETGACGPIYGFPEAYGVQTLVEDGGEEWEVVFCVRASECYHHAEIGWRSANYNWIKDDPATTNWWMPLA